MNLREEWGECGAERGRVPGGRRGEREGRERGRTSASGEHPAWSTRSADGGRPRKIKFNGLATETKCCKKSPNWTRRSHRMVVCFPSPSAHTQAQCVTLSHTVTLDDNYHNAGKRARAIDKTLRFILHSGLTISRPTHFHTCLKTEQRPDSHSASALPVTIVWWDCRGRVKRHTMHAGSESNNG